MVHAAELNARLKWFSNVSDFPSHDLQRQLDRSPAYDHVGDVRLMFKHDIGDVRAQIDHTTTLISGDSLTQPFATTAIDQTVNEDAARRVDLTWELSTGGQHRVLHRIDRAALQWQKGHWGVTVGRQALSWGSGIVFQPMDIFSPFAPTAIDRDYKPGNDLVVVDRLFANGHDVQILHVARRDPRGLRSKSNVASTAVKWHGYWGSTEYEVIGGQHYDEEVVGVSVRVPVGQALMRTDWVGTRTVDDDWYLSGIINADVSFVVSQRNVYAFVEYFHNDWGVRKLPDMLAALPLDLQERITRGELFNLMRDYIAVGGTFEWHPLITLNLTAMANLQDASSLWQAGISYLPSDQQSIQMGWIEPAGSAGKEFGGVPVLGRQMTTGGARRIYLRWSYFF